MKKATEETFNRVVYTPKPGEPKWEHPVLRGTPPPVKTIGPYDHSKDKGIQLLKRSLKIANAFPNLTETQQKMRFEMLLESKDKKSRKEINTMWEQINKDQGGVDKNTSTPQNPLWGNPEPQQRDTPLW